MIARLLVLLLALLAAPAAAQEAAERDCADDRGVDRCTAEQQRRTRALFGLRSIEEHRDAGDQARRVLYVDGYGNDVVAIAFVRARGREPTAFVHFPRRTGAPPTEPLEAPVPHSVWEGVLRRSALFHRDFAEPPQTGPSDSFVICLHSWVYTVEATDPARTRPPALRRTTEDACENGPAQMFATELAEAALPLFPHCARLDPRHHRNPAMQLAACRLLRGDRMAAAEVMNRLQAFQRARRVEDRHLLAGVFAHRARIDWRGTRSDPPDSDAGGFWLARMAAEGGPGFFVQTVTGLAADQVRVAALLERSDDGAAGSAVRFRRARVEMIWSFTSVGDFQVASVTVGDWERYDPDA